MSFIQPVHMRQDRRAAVAAALLLSVFSLSTVSAHALPPLPYETSFGSGSSWTVSTAGIGVAADSGAHGAAINPANLLSTSNELLGEADLWSAYSDVRGAAPADVRISTGAIHYITQASPIFAWGILYTPVNRYQTGLKYGSSEVLSRSQFEEISVAASFRLEGGRALGVQLGHVGGTSQSGVLLVPSDGDTLLTSNLWQLKAGYSKQWDSISGAVVFSLPAFGSVDVERPVNVTSRRVSDSYAMTGPLIVTAGLAKEQNGWTRAMDIRLMWLGIGGIDGETLPGNGLGLDAGVSARTRIEDIVDLTAGVNVRLIDPREISTVTIGFGTSYAFTEELRLYGGAGYQSGFGPGISGRPLEDASPWILRGGAIFHGE
jgi:hypothetical protein